MLDKERKLNEWQKRLEDDQRKLNAKKTNESIAKKPEVAKKVARKRSWSSTKP